jgi:hypothetical protein
MKRHLNDQALGLFYTPNAWNSTGLIEQSTWQFAADNGAFGVFNEKKFMLLLGRLHPYAARCLFVAAPDVVGDAAATLTNYQVWGPRIRGEGFKSAFVAQDGQTTDFPDCDALFIGGTTDWKLGADVPPLIDEAKRRGLWVHMGRVNSNRRISYAASLGVDSIDGSGYSRFPDIQLSKAIAHIVSIETMQLTNVRR